MSQMTIFLLAVAVAFAASVLPSRRVLAGRHWALRILGVVALLLLSAVFVTIVESERARRARFDPPQPALVMPSDSASLARGAHLVTVLGQLTHDEVAALQLYFRARLAAPAGRS